MIIDNFYTEFDKSHFYMGMVSQVYRDSSIIQVENLSWLEYRKTKLETLVPNTINFLVLVDSPQGLFIGEIYQSRVSNSDSVHNSMNNGINEKVYPEIGIDVVGLMEQGEDRFKLPGFKTVGITDKVYIANKKTIKQYLNSLELQKELNEKVLSSFATFSNLENHEVNLYPSTLFDRHLLTVGTTNSGKSTSALSIIDKLLLDQKKVMIVDPTGEYSESFNDHEVIKLKLGTDTAISVGDLSMQQWCLLFETNDATQPAVLSDAIRSLRYQKKNMSSGIYEKVNKSVSDVASDMASLLPADKDFIIDDLPQQIASETNQVSNKEVYVKNIFQFNSQQWLVQKVQNKLENTSFRNFFNNEEDLNELMDKLDQFITTPNQSIYIDTSQIGTNDGIGGMIIDLASNYIINKDRKVIEPFVMFIDEVHRYTKILGRESDYYTGLTTIAREGRKKGIFLFLTTQNPQDVSAILLGQVGTFLVHRLTHMEELRSLQNHLSTNNLKQVKNLNKGEAILTSINLLQDIHLKIKKSKRLHSNSTPSL
ncbi:ATP-binding protein [Marinilactibacillus sp. Marseille-P9653]|uniref:ATP-binding protein n=1 Tax=Marinilactibacillus sp. Marseille-P9653 TaxID=2866583 RepID=UPI001CE43157|nr:ATP-binding protein [Marinilactibacillus sp. Marseille-P9653]